jgi:uncharacterized protein
MPVILDYESMDEKTVGFTIKNNWALLGDISAVSVSYTGPSGSTECTMFDSLSTGVETSTVTAYCTGGIAMATVTIHSSSIKWESEITSEVCTSTPDLGTCAFEFMVPCTPDVSCTSPPTGSPTSPIPDKLETPPPSAPPTLAPTVPPTPRPTPDCLDGPIIQVSDVGTEDICVYGEMPVILDYESMDEKTVGFTIKNNWALLGDISAVSVSYTGPSGSTECTMFDSLSAGVETSTVTAYCTGGIAMATVTIHSSSIEWESEITSEVCTSTPDLGTCAFEFMVPCTPDVSCTLPPTSTPTTPPRAETLTPSVSPSLFHVL